MSSADAAQHSIKIIYSFESLFWKESLESLSFCLLFQFVWYFSLRKVFPLHLSSSRQFSWITTTTSSIVMTCSSIPYVLQYFKNGADLTTFPLLHDATARFFVCFFMSYLIADLALGFLFYRDQMNFVTGWLHHSLYLILLPILMSSKLEGGFLICSFMELPTIFLSLGYLSSKFKSELAFGISFFLTRILFHIYFGYQAYHSTPGVLLPIVAMFPLHLHWFGSWMKRQVRVHQLKKEQLSQLEKYD